MRDFNDNVVNGDSIKRAYGGATAARLNYYVKAIIEDDKRRYEQFYQNNAVSRRNNRGNHGYCKYMSQ